MDYGKVLSRAWQITWRWKVLWVLGFLVSLGRGSSQGGNSVNWVEDRGGRQFIERIPPEVMGILIALGCVALLLGIALWVLSVIGRGALIGGVQQVEEEGSTDLGQAWRGGVRRFWTLFGISILTGLPIFILALVVVVAFAGPIAAEVGLSAGQREPTGIFALSLLCGAPLCCGTIIAAIVLAQIQTYADRAAVIEGKGWIDAFRRGWTVLKENIGPTAVFWFIFFAIGLVFAIVIGGGVFVFILPLAIIFSETDLGPWLLVPLGCGGLVAVVIGAIVGSVVQTFTSATWTLAYRAMTGLGSPPPEAETAAP